MPSLNNQGIMLSEYQVGAVADIIAKLSKKRHISDSNETDIVSTPIQNKKGKKKKLSDTNIELQKDTVLKKDKKKPKKIISCAEQNLLEVNSTEIGPLLTKNTKKKKGNKKVFKSKSEEPPKKSKADNSKKEVQFQTGNKSKQNKTGPKKETSNLRESTQKNKKQLKKKVTAKSSKKSKAHNIEITTEVATDSKEDIKSEKNIVGPALQSEVQTDSVKDPTRNTESKQDNQAKTKGFPKHLGNNSNQENEDSKLNEEEESRTIFVGNLPLKITRSRVTNMFKPYGEVEIVRFRSIPVADIKLPRKACVKMNKIHEKRTNMNAYVRFKNIESVQKALEMNGHVINEHTIRVDEALKKAKTNSHAIFIGNLPFEAEEEELRKAFEDCGEIDNVRVIRDQHTNIGKGFAYVNFKSPDSVAFAMELEDVKIRNREVRIKRSFDKNHPDKSFGRFNSSKPISGGFQRNQGRFNRGGQSNRGSRGGFQGGNRSFSAGGSKFGNQREARNGNKREFGVSKSNGGFRGTHTRGGFKNGNAGEFKGRDNRGGFKGRNEGGRVNKHASSGRFKNTFRGSTVEEKGNRNNQKKKKLSYDAFKKFIIAKKLTGGSDKKKGFSFLSSS